MILIRIHNNKKKNFNKQYEYLLVEGNLIKLRNKKQIDFYYLSRPPSQHHQQQQQQEDPSKKYARIISQYEEQHGLKLGDMRVFAPKLRLRISSVNVNWINLPPIPKLPNKVHQS